MIIRAEKWKMDFYMPMHDTCIFLYVTGEALS